MIWNMTQFGQVMTLILGQILFDLLGSYYVSFDASRGDEYDDGKVIPLAVSEA